MKKTRIIKDTLNIMKTNWRNLGLIAVFDMMFILLLANLRVAAAGLNRWFFGLPPNIGSITSIIGLTLIVIIEFLSLAVIYSFFKYLILDNIQEMFRKTGLKFNRLFSFIKLNVLIVCPIMVAYTAAFILTITYFGKKMSEGAINPFSLLLNSLVVMILLLILLIYAYTLVNLSHSAFLKETEMKRALKLALINSLRLDSYKLYWSNLKAIFVYLIILLVYHVSMKLFVLKDTYAYLQYGGIYRTGLIAVTVATGYFLLSFNRISFYRITVNGIEQLK